MFLDYLLWLTVAVLLAWICRRISEQIHSIALGLVGLSCFIISIALAPWYIQLAILMMLMIVLS